MTITLISSVGQNGVIGAQGDLAWRHPEDLRRFKNLTMGHPVLMGRRTFASIGRALPGRQNIVITRATHWAADGAQVAHSVTEALAMASAADLFVIGGGEIYRQTIDLADRLEITHVDLELTGDTVFPDIAPTDWERIGVDRREGFSFVSYRRRPSPITALDQLLGALQPERRSGEYLFCSVATVPADVDPVVTVVETCLPLTVW